MEQLDERKLRAAFATILDAVSAFEKQLSPRDVALMQIGMRATHAEEALAHGEIDRARSHFNALFDLVKRVMPSAISGAYGVGQQQLTPQVAVQYFKQLIGEADSIQNLEAVGPRDFWNFDGAVESYKHAGSYAAHFLGPVIDQVMRGASASLTQQAAVLNDRLAQISTTSFNGQIASMADVRAASGLVRSMAALYDRAMGVR